LGLDIDAGSHYLRYHCQDATGAISEMSGSAQLAFAPMLLVNGSHRGHGTVIRNFGLKSETSHECSFGRHTRYDQYRFRTGAHVREGEDQQSGFLLW
jgi:hypothetical protein